MHYPCRNIAYNMRERALKIIVYFHFSETYLRMSQVMYALSANIHYSSSNMYRYHLQVEKSHFVGTV